MSDEGKNLNDQNDQADQADQNDQNELEEAENDQIEIEDMDLDAEESEPDESESDESEPDESESEKPASDETEPLDTPVDHLADWERLLGQFERELEKLHNKKDKAALFFDIGNILETQIGDPERALEAYQKAYEIDPHHQPTLKAAGRLFKDIGQWNLVLELLDSEQNDEKSSPEKVNLLIEHAEILAYSMDDQKAAIELLEQAIGLDKSNLTALRVMERLIIKQEDQEQTLAFYNKFAFDSNFTGQQLQLLQNLAQIEDSTENHQENAINTYKTIITLDSNNLLAISALKRLLVKYKKWDELLALYKTEEEITTEPSRLAVLKYLQARIELDHLGHSENAALRMSEGLLIDPSNALLLDEMEMIYQNSKDFKNLALVYEKQFEQSEDIDNKVDIAFKIGMLNLERSDDLKRSDDSEANDPETNEPEQAENKAQAAIWFEKALEIKPDFLPALQVLGKIYGNAGEDEKLLEILKLEAKSVDDKRLKASRFMLVASHAQHKLNDNEQAIEYYLKTLELLPGYLPAIKYISEIYSLLSLHTDLIELNELQIKDTSAMNEEQVVYLLEKNASLWEYLDNIEKAADCHRRILMRKKEYLPSIQVLGRLYYSLQNWKELIGINDLEADLINDQHRVVSLHYRSGEIYEKELDNIEQAIYYYRKVLTISPPYMPALKSLGAIYQQQGRFEELVKMYQRELQGMGSANAQQATRIRFKIAQIYGDNLDNPQKAETFYRQTLEHDPGFAPALHALMKLYQEQDNFNELILILEKQVENTDDHKIQLLSLYKIAELFENRLDKMNDAELTYNRILEIDEQNQIARRGLFRIYQQNNNRKAQLDILLPEIETQQDEKSKLALLATVADIYNEFGENIKDSLETYRRILNLDPDNDMAFMQLERLLLAESEFEDLADLYEAKLERIQNDEDRLPLLWLTIKLMENHLGDFERLVQAYKEVIRIEPFNNRVLEFFEGVFIQERRFEKLLDIYERMGKLTENSDQQFHLLLSSGQILEVELSKTEEALGFYLQALELKPGYYPVVQGIKRIYAKLERWEDLAEVLASELNLDQNQSSYISTAYQLGYLQETKFDNTKSASDYYIKVLKLDPGHKESYLRVKDLLIDSRQFEKLVEIYQRRLSVLDLKEEWIKLHKKIADLAENELSDIDLAITHNEKLLELEPANLTQKRKLADLLAKVSRVEDAITIYEEVLDKLDDSEQLKDLNYTIGCIYQDKLKNHSRAVSAFETVLSYDADNLQAMDRLGTLYKELGLTEEAFEIFEKLLGYDLPREKQVRYNLSIGEIHMDQLGNDDEATKFFEKSLELDPNNQTLLNTLSTLFEKHAKWDKLVSLYEINIERQNGDDNDQAIGLLMGLANIYSNKLGDVEQALEKLTLAAAIDPYNMDIQALQANVMGMNALYYLDAVDKHRQLLKLNPFRLESYKELYRIFKERKEIDKSFAILIVMDFLKILDNEQQAEYKKLKEQTSSSFAAVIPEDKQLELLTHPNEQSIIGQILTLLEPTLYKMLPPDLAKYDLGNCKQAGVESSIYHLLENSAYHLGVDLFKLYLSQKTPDSLFVENTKPATIIMGGNLAFSSEGIKKFMAGMLLSRIKFGHVPFVSKTPEKLEFWVECLCHLYIPEVMVRNASIDEVQDFSQKLNLAINKSSRKEFERLAGEYHKLGGAADFIAYQNAMKHTDNRLGLLLAGDLNVAAECLQYLETQKPYRIASSTSDLIEAFRSNKTIKELMRFAISEQYFELRKLIRVNVD